MLSFLILNWQYSETQQNVVLQGLETQTVLEANSIESNPYKLSLCVRIFQRNRTNRDYWKWKSLSRVQLFATPWTTQSMEFSRPEYWSGEPFPSPGDLPNPGIKPRSLTLQADSLPAEPPGKPKNTGLGSLSLLQQLFLTQESNQGLLYCRRILYQLSY